MQTIFREKDLWLSAWKERKKICKSPSSTFAADAALIVLLLHGMLNFLDFF